MAPATFYCVLDDRFVFAAILLTLVIVSDLLDGWLARRLDATSRIGGLLDHSADAIFIATLLGALALRGEVTPLLPVLVVASFAQYVFDSAALAGQHLRTSVIGRWNGIAYFVPAGFAVYQPALGLTPLPAEGIVLLAWLLVVSTLISMSERLWTWLRLPR